MFKKKALVTGKVLKNPKIKRDVRNGKSGTIFTAYDATDETRARIGFWIEIEVVEGVYLGVVASLKVASSNNPDSPWYQLEIVNSLWVKLPAMLDLNEKVIEIYKPD